MRSRWLIAACAFASACSREADWQRVPEQKTAPVVAPAPPPRMSVRMSDADAPAYFVKDISPTLEAATWRWTYDRPELRFPVKWRRGLRCFMDFSLPAATVKDTGPVTVTFFVNAHVAGKVRYAKDGLYRFEKPVPADWISKDGPTELAAQANPVWIDPRTHAHLGFILIEAGFAAP